MIRGKLVVCKMFALCGGIPSIARGVRTSMVVFVVFLSCSDKAHCFAVRWRRSLLALAFLGSASPDSCGPLQSDPLLRGFLHAA